MIGQAARLVRPCPRAPLPKILRFGGRDGYYGRMKLDNRDLQILSILHGEGRINKSELAGRVSLSPAACWDRLKRLEQAGFIRGYHAEVAPEKIATDSRFLVQIELESHHADDFKRFEDALRAIPPVLRCPPVARSLDQN